MNINVGEKIRQFVRKEPVTSVSFVLAVISMFFVHPDTEYVGYIHWSTLSVLLSLMLITSGLRSLGVFKAVGQRLLLRASSPRSIAFILVGLCYFLSPFITNDVSLITFVPFSIFILEMANLREYVIPILSLQTIAAHMGSSISPIGNPHNLYLYNLSGLSTGEFMLRMLPYFLVAGILLTIAILIITRNGQTDSYDKSKIKLSNIKKKDRATVILYGVLFVLCILSVCHIFNYYIVLAIVVLAVFFLDKSNFKNPDYCLLFTFAFLFIFVGNMSRIEAIQNLLCNIVNGHEIITTVLASQIISNVPASILIPNFTDKYMLVCIAADIGGLGTLIASMANLISFKQYALLKNSSIKKYIVGFTIINVAFLIPLTALALIIK